MRTTVNDLAEWVETWNRVCFAADPSDDIDPPSWEEVKAAELPGWRLEGVTAEGWGAYMRQRLIHLVESYLLDIGEHPVIRQATQPHNGEQGS